MSLPLLPWGWSSMVTASAGAWLSAIYLGLLPSALGFVLWGVAVRALPMVVSTSLLYLVPGVAVLIAFVWLGERPIAGEAVGGLIILAGVALLTNVNRFSRGATAAERRQTAACPASPADTRTPAMQAG
jgi:drug/metabolite transporter (DMT)-like permease